MRMTSGFVAIQLPAMGNSILTLSAYRLNNEVDKAGIEYTLAKFREMYFDGTRQVQNPEVLNVVNAHKAAYAAYKANQNFVINTTDVNEAETIKYFNAHLTAFGFVMLGNVTDINDLFTRLYAVIKTGDITLDQAYIIYLWMLVFVSNFVKLNDFQLPDGYRLN